jgi:hypothetical protein
MLTGKATRTDTLMDKCGDVRTQEPKLPSMLASWNPTQTASLNEAAAISHFSTRTLHKGCRERKSQEVQVSLQSAWAPICANHLHDQWGHGRGIPATDLAPAFEEG